MPAHANPRPSLAVPEGIPGRAGSWRRAGWAAVLSAVLAVFASSPAVAAKLNVVCPAFRDGDKLARSMRVSLRKRPVDDDKLEQVVNGLVRQLETLGENEVTTKRIGELVMETLYTVDHVGYVRYASVYKDFRSPADFNAFVDTLKRDLAADGQE